MMKITKITQNTVGFKIFVFIFVLGDLISTAVALNAGWMETNPLGIVGMIALKMVVVAFIYCCTPLWNQVSNYISSVVCYGLAALGLLVIANNLNLISVRLYS